MGHCKRHGIHKNSHEVALDEEDELVYDCQREVFQSHLGKEVRCWKI